MDLNNLKLFQMATERMDWLCERQQVLSHNIANSDTPGYGPKHLKKLQFREMMRPQMRAATLEKTSLMHIEATRKNSKYWNDSEKDTHETPRQGTRSFSKNSSPRLPRPRQTIGSRATSIPSIPTCSNMHLGGRSDDAGNP